MTKKRIIIGISGASGIIYGYRILERLAEFDVETHLIVSDAAKITLAYETNLKVSDLTGLATVTHKNDDIAACIASGSYHTLGMIVAPCSMKTLADISSGTASTLLSRAADVILKERRRLVLMTRETPLNLIHIRNMAAASEAGAIIYPPVPAFYAKPENIDDLVDHTVARVLDLFDLASPAFKRWGQDVGKVPKV